MTSTDTKTWLITGAGRGMGIDFARAALAAGHNVVATGRNLDTVRSAIGEHERLLVAEPRAVDRPRPRRRPRRRLTSTRQMQITNSRRPLCVER
jgi:NAD(P)-dependent dehydrogenase (short-subunit alcohol dehydrogenase family)